MTERPPEPRPGRALPWGGTLLALALVLAGLGMAPDLDGPWRRGWLGHNGARYSHIARNYARDGLLAQGGAPRMDTAGEDPERPLVYGHHPPGVSMLVGMVFGLTGPDERVARLVSFAATLVSLGLLFLLVRQVTGCGLVAGLAALLTGALPMTPVFGTHVEVQGPQVLAAGLAVLLAYDRGRRGASWAWWGGAVVLASWFDWFGLYFAAGCAGHALLAAPRRPRLAVTLAAVTAALFAGWVFWLGSLPGMTPSRVFGAAGVRVDGGPGAHGAGGLGPALLSRALQELDLLPAWPLLLGLALELALRAGWLPARLAGRGAGLSTRWLMLVLLAPPVVHSLLFPAGLAVHSYWLFALPPALGTAAALTLARLPPLPAALVGIGLALAGAAAVDGVREVEDGLPALVGTTLAATVDDGRPVLTNYPANVLRFGEEGDAHHVRLPEVTWYADRPVRGGIDRVERLQEALRRLPRAGWFLLTSYPPPEDPGADLEGLAAALDASCPEPPRRLSGDPPAWLYRFAR